MHYASSFQQSITSVEFYFVTVRYLLKCHQKNFAQKKGLRKLLNNLKNKKVKKS